MAALKFDYRGFNKIIDSSWLHRVSGRGADFLEKLGFLGIIYGCIEALNRRSEN
jgi:hypothetical protein